MTARGRLLHVDGSAGVAGDMMLGALVDLGVPVSSLREGLAALGLPGWSLSAETVQQHGLRATRVKVDVAGDDHGDHLLAPGDAHGRSLAEIEDVIRGARLPERVEARALATFRKLCEEEAALHGATLADVHLHEAGAVDAIVDVVGTCLGLEHLEIDRVSCSPPELGGGTVRCLHGVLPVPTPATLALLRGRPVRTSGVEGELTTPTGAALLVTLSESWGTLPPMTVERVGYGAGTRKLADRPNVVRLTLGVAAESSAIRAGHVEIVADLDDAEPEALAAAADELRERGAVDVVLSATTMKKGRPGVRLTIVAPAAARERLLDTLFAETTTIGCRWHEVQRAECEREVVPVETPHGSIRFKLARWRNRLVNAKPEHDDCLAAARRAGVPLKVVVADALAAFAKTHGHERHGRDG